MFSASVIIGDDGENPPAAGKHRRQTALTDAFFQGSQSERPTGTDDDADGSSAQVKQSQSAAVISAVCRKLSPKIASLLSLIS